MRATTLRPTSREVTPFTATDLTIAEGGEPTVQDLVLAERLGFRQTRDIRQLIERNREELEAFGGLRCGTANPGKAGGRPGREFFLNRQQALLVTILSKTSIAAQVRRQMIEVFDAALRGVPQEPPRKPTLPRDADLFVEDDEKLAISRRQLCDVTMAIWQSIPSIVESVINERGATPALPKRKEKPAIDPNLSVKRAEAGRKGGLQRGANLAQAAARETTPTMASGVPAMSPTVPVVPPSNLLYGLAAIGAFLGITERQAKHRALAGHIPTFKIGHSVCARRADLTAWIDLLAAEQGGRAGVRVSA